MPPKKRKSAVSSETADTPAKRTRSSTSGVQSKKSDESKGPTPAEEKGESGRPSKNTAEKVTTPKKDTPKPGKEARPKKSAPNAVDGADDRKSNVDESKPNSQYQADEDGRQYWLMKAEPESRLEKGVDVRFSIDDLHAVTEPEAWDGVRNAVARNHMRAMKKGDYAFFYHSNCKVPGIAGYMQIVREHSVDESAFDPAHPYYDEKSNRNNPKWSVVHVEFRRKFDRLITLSDLKSHAADGPLQSLQTLKQSRLSVSPVTPEQWRYIVKLAGEDQGGGSKDPSKKPKSEGNVSAAEEHGSQA